MGSLFFLVFSTELAFRILSRGPLDFYFGEQWRWAAFDTFMVSIQGIDELPKVIPQAHVAANMSILRLLRILRILRITRALRMLRLFEVLATVTNSMAASVAPAFWAL